MNLKKLYNLFNYYGLDKTGFMTLVKHSHKQYSYFAVRPEEPYDNRSLYEKLQEQKQKKDLEYEEAHKLSK